MHRLLFITETYPPDRGGMSESCDRIVRGLFGASVAIDLVHFDRRAATPSFRRTAFGSQLHFPLDTDAAHTINCLWNRLQHTLDLSAITHVVAFGGALPLLSAPAFAAWISRPLITLLRGNELDAGLFDPRRRSVLDDALRRSALVCTVTSAQAEKAAALHPGCEVRVTGNGIDFDLWSATDEDRERGRAFRQAQVGPDRRLLGVFGHLKAKKGLPFFVDTLSRAGLAERVHLLLVGEIETAPTDVPFTHLPPMDRFSLLPYYTAADLIVLPSHYDGFPNVLIEAMALGKPLLASAVGGMADVLTDGQNAFLFSPGDEHGCADASRRAVEADHDTLRAMGESARAVARLRCDARDETRRYLEALDFTGEKPPCHESPSYSPPV